MTVNELKTKLNILCNEKSLAQKTVLARELLSECIDYIYEINSAEKPPKATLLELLDSPVVAGWINDTDIVRSLHYIRILGMNASHGKNVRKKEAETAERNIAYLVGLLAAKEAGTAAGYQKPPYMSEAETRKLYIDLYLQEAGWEVLGAENMPQPGKAGIEIEVQGMPNPQGLGYCDYVLYGKDGRPLAIVEVKKTSVDPVKGRHQVDLYGECMRAKYGYKPVLYYTNGYTIKIIDGIYPDRGVAAFHSLADLERMMQRRGRGPITDMNVNKEITGRPYQQMAITSICERFNGNFRRGLLVMATGTGKTRVSISLVDILARNGWVKNVLFLADRTALVNQAKRNFAKLLPDMSICELSAPGEKDYNARLIFCTYQTMINYIDAEDKPFSAGRFDLIIIDEAHRSIFNRYGTIFQYFDSLLVGLTATPKNEVDANTYQIFGCEAGIPDFNYALEEAIQDKYLVGYKVINRTSRLISDGIRYDELTDEEKAQLEEYLDYQTPTPDFTISGSVLFKYLFNKNTCRQVIEELMRWGLRTDNNETLGKTIIFAYNHEHAQMIVDCFHELYPAYPANTCQLVDYYVNYGEDLVIKFEEDPEFRIAVSVDMLDTGVDVPAVLNLVFFKKVRSKIKFMQMIGRGTRLCEDIYGPGRHKSGFLIFDYCGNFEFFGTHPDGKEGKEILTLSQRIFQIRLDMLFELQRLEYQQDAWHHAYYDKIKTELHTAVVKIKGNDSRIQVRQAMQYVDKYYDCNSWTSLSPVLVREISNHITPLIDSGLYGEPLSAAFDARMYLIEKALLRDGNISAAAEHVKNVRLIAQYLVTNKASVPQVLAKAADLNTLAGDAFWLTPTCVGLERLRDSLRDLMRFLKGMGQGKFEIDIPDDINTSSYVPDDTAIDIRTYREKVMDYLAEHSDNQVIQKIHNLKPITDEDLAELEKILWTELGTKEEYNETTDITNLAAFVRSLIGLSQEAVNEKFGEYLSGNRFNARQQEFVKSVINYVRENGDIETADLVNNEPFSNYDISEIFGLDIFALKTIIDLLHSPVTVNNQPKGVIYNVTPAQNNLNAAAPGEEYNR